MSNNITKTIMESLETFEENFGGDNAGCDGCSINQREAQKAKSHLLQSQIRLIEAVIEEMRKKAKQAKIKARDHKVLRDFCCGEWQALEDQISSLNETLEFLKKSL